MWRTHVVVLTAAFIALFVQVAESRDDLDSIPESQIVLVNAGLRVPFGRSVFLDPEKQLKIHVYEGERCEIRVMEDDFPSPKPGRVTPTNFPCRFNENEVQYTHYGSRSPNQDRIKLLLRYDSHDDTIILPVAIDVQVLFEQLEVVTRNMPLVVDRLRGLSTPIDSKTLQFTYDRATQECKVAVLSPKTGYPRYGDLEDPTQVGVMFECEDLLQAGIRYQHTADTASPNRDYLPMAVELTDRRGNLVKQEFFQVTVRLKDGQENTPPMVSFSALLLMDVNQFVMTAITPNTLQADDLETPLEKLIFNITKPLGFGEGHIVSTDDRNLPITTFHQKDVQDLKVAYKPPASDSDVRRLLTIEMVVLDSEELSSDPFVLMIVVNPMNTLAPVATRNTGISLFEGQARRLQSSKNLEISDEDNMDSVTVNVVDGLRHGELLLMGTSSRQFSPADLDAGLVMYQHDDSDTYSDNIIFRMSDGEHEVEFLFPITIFPEDDEPPILNVNTGVTLHKGEDVEITSFVLSAADVDSDDETIRFVLEEPLFTQGMLLLQQNAEPDDPENWHLEDGLYEKAVMEWTQLDLVEGRVHYRHTGEHMSEPIQDVLSFKLSDDHEPPNESKVHKFIITILPLDDIPPEPHSEATFQMTVDEFELTEFTKAQLRFTDSDSDDRKLQYTIIVPPFDIDANNPTNAGSIVFADKPSVIVSTFTQAQVNHHKIAYKPPSLELGLTPRVLQFEFQVEDESGNILPQQVFTILLQPVDNKPPTVLNTGFRVFENGFVTLTPEILDVTDPDTLPDSIVFRIVEEPKYGTLQYQAERLTVGKEFTRSDIALGRIAYINGGTETERDNLKLEVSDGVHKVLITIRITVRPVDDEAPKLLKGGTLGAHLEVPEHGSVPITSKTLKASDPDTDELMLTFILEEPPQLGEIHVNGKRTDRFTQKEIEHGDVSYVHMNGEVGYTKVWDSFNLTLSDMSDEWIIGGNRINQVKVNVSVDPVDNVFPEIFLGPLFIVPEGGKRIITSDFLHATDKDSEDDDITCTIWVQPEQGYVENIAPLPGSERSRTGIPITAFTIGDIKAKSINYVQSIHRGVEPREDRFGFGCSDGVNTSPRYTFYIGIEATNDEIPELVVHEFVVLEGMDLNLDNSVLNAIDLDEPKDTLMVRIAKQPKHGKIIHHSPLGTTEINNFTLEQILQGSSVVYSHDDSETRVDHLELELSDGMVNHTVKKELRITILPIDDETPRLSINDGIQVKIGETRTITNRMLRAEDLDSDDESLAFIIRLAPKHGYLFRTDGSQLQKPLYNLTRGMNFTQKDVNIGVVKYTHTGREGVRDLIKFDITDGYNPLIDRYFYVMVDGVDSIYPDVVNKGMELPEGGRVTLTTDILSTSDLNSDDALLTFTITRAPTKGHLENTDQPGIPIALFSQLQLAGNKIYYLHTSDDEIKMDSFEFEVTDGHNSVFRTFRISLSDVDNKKPVLFLEKLVVKENGRRLITPFELKIEDRDTNDRLLQFVVTQVPIHGTLLYNGTKPATAFTMADLYDNLISYRHDGSETTRDSFSIVITDGTHSNFYVFPETNKDTRKPQKVQIEVAPVDNQVPRIVINRGTSYIGPLSTRARTPEQLGYRITNKILRAEDPDSPNDQLLFVITDHPRHGFIADTYAGLHALDNFTQGDIDKMRICYILNGTFSNATSDAFNFKVIDKGGNELSDLVFHLNWAWVSFEKDYYSIPESENYLIVNLKRRGYLGETSFVGIAIKELSARKDLDYHRVYAQQVQFSPGQTEAQWRLRILPDQMFERGEQLEIHLKEPIMAAIEAPNGALITILDEEDESKAFILDREYKVKENVGELLIPIRRTGDLSGEMMAICYTESGSAAGTIPTTVLSYSDYISRYEDHGSAVRFDRGQDTQLCRIVIIDDSLFEDEEQFTVHLSHPTGGQLGNFNQTVVTILPDENDVPSLYFGESNYIVDENAGYIEILVWRTGTDLSKQSSVTVRSKPSDPPSAEAGHDYVGIGKGLDFAPGVTMQTVRITILDDLGHPHLEGVETFEVILIMPWKAVLGDPSQTTVHINDTLSDLPRMEFREVSTRVPESDGKVIIPIKRNGDLNHLSYVRCYTRQGSAKVSTDYEERTDTNDSVIIFMPGESEQNCTATLVDDNIHEDDKEFTLILGSPNSTAVGGARVGVRSSIKITITDSRDKPVIRFEQTRFSVKEPIESKEPVFVKVPIVRSGDLSKSSVVRVHTKDGSAKSGEDYFGLSKELEFKPNVGQIIVEIQILFDTEKEHREAFTIHLKPDKNMVSDIKDHKAVVYIQETKILADVTFPSPPMVVSLRDYDNAAQAQKHPIAGYPLVCITPCNPKHPDFSKTGLLCTKEEINDTLTRFRWRVAAPNGEDGVTSALRDVESNTVFTNTHLVTLDSIYFTQGSRVQCSAQAVNVNGDRGLELPSSPVVISLTEGVCLPRIAGSFGAEPFTAKMRYTGPEDTEYPNLVRLSVVVPHCDGMFPVISTRSLSNFELTLSPDGIRVGTHRCSNLLDSNEVKTKHGFITEAIKNIDSLGEVEPYQFSPELRSSTALRFYRNLDLESCMWEFVSYYDMSELVTECGGTINTDGQVLNLLQSFVSVQVPLYVSYIFHSPVATGGWQHNDLTTQLRLTFVYDTAILWQNGIGSPEDSPLQGYLYPISMRIRDDGRLVVHFRTEARFLGTFVVQHPSSSLSSTIKSAEHPELTFTLDLIRSEPTYSQPEQEWQFVSDYAMRDYSGKYNVNLVPCTVSEDALYTLPAVCNPRSPVAFELQIRFQQVSDPVPAEFSLNTAFYLMRKRELWSSDGAKGFGEDADAPFEPGDTIYGRIMVDPVQNVGTSFYLNVEKCFICTGVEGYVPKYNPHNNEFGCIAESQNLLHNFKVIDKGAPNTVHREFRSIQFNAILAVDDVSPDANTLLKQPGADGFRIDSAPLFQVSYGSQWFIHCIYTVRSRENAARGIGKRSLEYHSFGSASTRPRRDVRNVYNIGNDGRGTNMHRISLDYGGTRQKYPNVPIWHPGEGKVEVGTNPSAETELYLLPTLLALAASLVVCAIIMVIVMHRRKKNSAAMALPTNTVTIVPQGKGQSKIVIPHYVYNSSGEDNTEV